MSLSFRGILPLISSCDRQRTYNVRPSIITQGHTRSHRVTQGHTGPHRVTQGHTGSHRVTQGHTGWGRVIQGHAGSYRVMQDHVGLCRVTQCHAGSNKVVRVMWATFHLKVVQGHAGSCSVLQDHALSWIGMLGLKSHARWCTIMQGHAGSCRVMQVMITVIVSRCNIGVCTHLFKMIKQWHFFWSTSLKRTVTWIVSYRADVLISHCKKTTDALPSKLRQSV